MSKRKELNGNAPGKRKKTEDEDSDEDMDELNVDFEWFDPQPEVDFHGLKTLMRQLFDVDNQLFDLSALADLILSQPLLGSTVKCDGNESDPYAFLTVLNLQTHGDKSVIQELTKYLIDKSANSTLSDLPGLLSLSSNAQVGLILTERFVNVPSEVSPGMYKCLLEEIQWALEEKEPYEFSHYLVASKVYTEVESKLDQEDDRPTKKKRKDDSASELFYFHPEDEILHKHAIGYHTFEYSKQGDEGASDSKRAFSEMGIKPQGHMILIEAAKFKAAVEAVESYLQPST